MEKIWYSSKTVQGIVLAAAGALWGIWAGEVEVSRTIVTAGVAWSGYGLRDALTE